MRRNKAKCVHCKQPLKAHEQPENVCDQCLRDAAQKWKAGIKEPT